MAEESGFEFVDCVYIFDDRIVVYGQLRVEIVEQLGYGDISIVIVTKLNVSALRSGLEDFGGCKMMIEIGVKRLKSRYQILKFVGWNVHYEELRVYIAMRAPALVILVHKTALNEVVVLLRRDGKTVDFVSAVFIKDKIG